MSSPWGAAAKRSAAGQSLQWQQAQPVDVASRTQEDSFDEMAVVSSVRVPTAAGIPERIAALANSVVEQTRCVGKLLREALSSQRIAVSSIKIAEVEQALKDLPFKSFQESAVTALKKGIPIDKFEEFVKARIAPRYNMPEKHVQELLDTMYTEVNQASITDFAFHPQQECTGQGVDSVNTFVFARIAVFRRRSLEGAEVVDMGYCFYKCDFVFGKEKIIRHIETRSYEEVPRKFLCFTIGKDSYTKITSETREEWRDVQLSLERTEQIKDYFRYKVTQFLAADALESGGEVEKMVEGPRAQSPLPLGARLPEAVPSPAVQR